MKNTYQTIIHFDMSPSDYKVMTLLYAPLLGHKAYALYQTLYNLKMSNTHTFHEDFLCLMLNFKEEELLKARQSLESFELLTTLQNQTHFILQLKRPLTAKGFLTDVLFGVYLEHEFGLTFLNELMTYFEVDPLDTKNYQNISKSFSEMHTFSHHQLLKVDKPLFDNGGPKSKRQSIHFDLEALIESLPKRYQKSSLLKPDIQHMLQQLAFVYQFGLEDLKKIILRLDADALDNKPQLSLQAKLYFDQQEKSLQIEKTEISQDEVVSNISPFYIVKKYGTMDAYAQSLDTIVQLISRNQVEIGIINTLIVFVLKRKEGVLPHLHYLEKILSSWQSQGVKTTKDATELISSLDKNNTKNQKRTSSKPRSVEPEWFESFLKKLEEDEATR